MTELSNGAKIIGTYCLCNTAAVCIHEIDHSADRVLASINGENPEWCFMDEKNVGSEDGSLEHGFWFGEMFIPFSEVMRV